jgi:hypothetical protein
LQKKCNLSPTNNKGVARLASEAAADKGNIKQAPTMHTGGIAHYEAQNEGNISGANQGIRANPCKPTNKSRKKFLKKLCIYFVDYYITV